MTTAVIMGDPEGLHSLMLMNRGIQPENIWVWENDENHFHAIKQQHAKINLIEDLSSLDMKHFEYSLGNPPFSDTTTGKSTKTTDLDSQFVKWGIKHSNKVGLVVRAKHFHDKNSSMKKLLFEGNHLVSLKYLPEETFNGVYVKTCRFLWDRNYVGETEITYSGGVVRKQLLNKDSVVFLDNPSIEIPPNNMMYRWKRGKLNLNKIVEDESGVTFIKALGRGENPETCKVSLKLEATGYHQHAVIIGNMGSETGIGRVMIKPYEAVAGHSIVQLNTKSYEESVALKEYLTSDKMREYIKKIKFSNPNPKSLFELIPDL